MTIQRPGEFNITDRAVELAQLKPGDKVLDIGCGEGDALNHLITQHKLEGQGIDMSLDMIDKATRQYPQLDVKLGDGEFLDEFTSYTFDGIFMECSLSLINLPDEALHEAYCVLKKGGRLILSDVYEIDPEPNKLKAVAIEAERQSKIPHKEGDCEEDTQRFVNFRLKGAFFKDPLIAQLEEIGYEIIAFEDRSDDLQNYVAQTLMEHGSLTSLITDVSADDKRKLGYFLLVAKKPE